MVIAHNMMAMNAQRQFNIGGNHKKKSTEKLASGYRINRAADDAAGLAISEKMRRQIRGLNQGAENIQDGISLIQVADGALTEVQDMLHRMTELSVKAANGTNTIDDRGFIQTEIDRLAEEINRIGKTTTFNDLPIFDDMYGKEPEDSITNLVTSKAAESGYLTDAIKVGPYWFPSATIDFSGITENNIGKLDNQGFEFCCSRGCDEVFDFKFKTDGTPSSSSNLNGKVRHYYTIDISKCKSGSDIVNEIFSYVSAHQPTGNAPDGANKLSGCIEVSHSNYMIQTADGNGLTIYANRRIAAANNFVADGYLTEEEAKKAYPSTVPGINQWAGQIDCSQLLGIVADEKINEINIQCSGEPTDALTIHTHRMNAAILGVGFLNVKNQNRAAKTIELVKKAGEKILSQRSELGAFQNRLEHSIANNRNTSENTQAAESLIRDTDMAKEMVELSKQNILEQIGQSMIAQANQGNQVVLSLLQ